ncbi:MAG: 4-hydroxy-tetrahydrodipicolinate synthase [Ignavibacteriales bacterium CG_4_9_14_3_um_filter_30_11]|nr:MAG: 4-hydroxy-tetrahydrodipicolinate synthase [Ignavibacteriales bacterium CG_4_9_14_3_um_filter_30_11]
MFNGVGTAIITPFLKNGEVDYNSLKRITKFQTDNKIDAIIILGTTGEAPVITDEERYNIIKTVTETAKKKCKIIIGTGSNDTKKVIFWNKQAEEFKPDGLLIVNPYYNKGTQESLIEHYSFISSNTKLPIILYNVPSRTSMNLLPETVVKIHNLNNNIVAVKEASGSISQIAHLCSIKPKSLFVFSGNDDQTLPIMSLGANGVISVFSNSYPKQMKQIVDSYLNKNYDKSLVFHNKYLKMMNDLFIETNPAPIKYVMSKLGYCENKLRLPLGSISDKSKEILNRSMLEIK